MHKIAVIGEAESIVGFASIGIETHAVSNQKQAKEKLDQLAKSHYAVIYVTEAIAGKIADTINKYNCDVTPAIILIPGIRGNTGEGVQKIEKSIEKAVGAQLLD